MKLLFFAGASLLCIASAGISDSRHILKSPIGNTGYPGIVITEILADPSPAVGLPDAEFVEILNRDSVAINLAGWTFFDGSVRILPAVILQPGAYGIICDDNDTALFASWGLCIPVSAISLTNGGEKIAIRDPLGLPVDSVTYAIDWFAGSAKADGGWSLEMIDPFYPCKTPLNWKPSVDPAGGTPGGTNSVYGTIADHIRPVLLRAWCPDLHSVELIFSEPVDSNAMDLSQYSFTGALLAQAVAFTPGTSSRVQIHFQDSLKSGTIYSVRALGISDCSGNTLPGDAAVARFGIPDTTHQPTLTFNEVLFHPETGGFDFLELYHLGTEITDLSAYTLTRYNTENGIPESPVSVTDEPWLVFPGDYMVLTENTAAIAQKYPSSYPFRFVRVNTLPAMNVDAGILSLHFKGHLTDSLVYAASYHFELLNDPQGISLEKINPYLNASDSASWHSASPLAGSATPGLKNSEYAGWGTSGTGLEAIPEVFTPDQDGENDVVTFLFSPGKPGFVADLTVYNIDGQVIYKTAAKLAPAEAAVFVWDGINQSGYRASQGIYVAFLKMFHPSGEIRKYKVPFVLALR